MPKYQPKGTNGSTAIVLGVLAIIGGITTGQVGFIAIGAVSLIVGFCMGG
jgi:hypothetical protein